MNNQIDDQRKCEEMGLTGATASYFLALHLNPYSKFSKTLPHFNTNVSSPLSLRRSHLLNCRSTKSDDDDDDLLVPASPLLIQEDLPNPEVKKSVQVLKNAAKTRKVAAEQVLSALSVIEKEKLDPSEFLHKLGGSKSPGRTWMLIFTAKKNFNGGSYFPVTAVQRFDAAGKRIENGVYFGRIGSLTFEGRLSWKKRMLAFVFESIRIKVGPLNPLVISIGEKEDREPSTSKDPFFIWFYIDEEIAVARGRQGGTAFWCRCNHVATELTR